MNILEKIVEAKREEIRLLHEQYDLRELSDRVTLSHPVTSVTPRFYQALAETRASHQPFFITEFKRKSPSEGWINRDADLPTQVLAYAQSGAGAISVLTDTPFFGGSYTDLQRAAETLRRLPVPPLLLQKDFILDPIQIYLAKLHGADIILLIAAILEPEHLDFLKKTAESLGIGVLVEVHDAEELAKIGRLDFPVLGINNRDLKTFRTALNRVNVLSACPGPDGDAAPRFIIAESGIRDYRDFQAVRRADGFLIGTGLMRGSAAFPGHAGFSDHFQSRGRFLFKACGIRTAEAITDLTNSGHQAGPLSPDFIGINFSPVSKRRIEQMAFQTLNTAEAANAIAVFYKNTETEIRETLEQYPFRSVQLYADDVSPAFVRSLKQRVLLAVRVTEGPSWSQTLDMYIEPFAADVDFFILDGAVPGSGQRIGTEIPADFPYPFLLAGGLHEGNLEAIRSHKNCIGADIASGIETDGKVDVEKIRSIARRLPALASDLDSGTLPE